MSDPVLVIADNLDIAEGLRVVLTIEEYAPTIETSVEDGLARLRSGPAPRAIVLDAAMRPSKCRSFMEELGKKPELAWIPVVFMSAAADGAAVAKDLGAYGHLSMPLVAEDLLAILGRAVKLLPSGRNGAARMSG